MRTDPPATEMSDGVPARPVRGVRVLVVDDYPDNAESMAVLLRLYGHEVETALSGPTALESARAKRGLPGGLRSPAHRPELRWKPPRVTTTPCRPLVWTCFFGEQHEWRIW